MNLVSLNTSAGARAELGVRTVAVSAAPVAPKFQEKPASPQTTNIQTPAGAAHRPPCPPASARSGSGATPGPPPYPPADRFSLEPACGLVDLDIICVDDKTGLFTTTETEGGAKRPSDTVDVEASSSSETENSSDFTEETESGEETGEVVSVHRLNHNALEKQRRRKMWQLFEGLRREVGLSQERTSKVSTLTKAVQVIQQLRKTETDLEKKKRRLMKRRDDFLTTIAPSAERGGQVSRGHRRSPERVAKLPERGGTGSTDANLIEVVDLLDETDEVTDNSSDEERVVTKTTGVLPVTDAALDEVLSVDVETVEEESGQLKAAQRTQPSIPESSPGVKKVVVPRSVTAAFKLLSSVMNTKKYPKTVLLKQAHKEIQTLQNEAARLKSLKICLNQQRNAYIREIARRSGKSERRIMRTLQHPASKQKKVGKRERHRAANHVPAGDTIDDDIVIISSDLPQQTPQAPPTLVSAPPTSTPSATPVQTPVQQPQNNSQKVLQVTPPGASPNALAGRDRPRTIPNILSRSKNPAPLSPLLTKTHSEELPSFQALVPADVLSLVSATLPGQPVLTLSPIMTGPTVLQTSPTPGLASVTLNFPSLTNQQIHLTSLPHPPTASNLNSLLPVQPSTPQQQTQPKQQQQPQQQLQQPPPPPQLQQQQQEVLAGQTPAPVVSGSDLVSDQIKDQHQPPSQAGTKLESPPSTSSPPSTHGSSSSPCPDPSTGRRVTAGGPLRAETREDADHESLTSLLNEIVFLNQQTVATLKPSSEAGQLEEAAAVSGAEEQGHAPHSPWLLQLDSDSDDALSTEMTQSEPQPGPANGKGGALAPPPLLQMKVGGAKVTVPASSDGAAGGEGEGIGRGAKRGGGVAWRPMPRLVPLGLRGNPPS